jgi:hypothetical protein
MRRNSSLAEELLAKELITCVYSALHFAAVLTILVLDDSEVILQVIKHEWTFKLNVWNIDPALRLPYYSNV